MSSSYFNIALLLGVLFTAVFPLRAAACAQESGHSEEGVRQNA